LAERRCPHLVKVHGGGGMGRWKVKLRPLGGLIALSVVWNLGKKRKKEFKFVTPRTGPKRKALSVTLWPSEKRESF